MSLIESSLDAMPDDLAIGDRSLVSIVGGGGKTTTLFALGAGSSGRRVLTTTTKMGSERDDGVRVVIDPSDDRLRDELDAHDQVLVWRDRGAHRADGVAPADCDRWFTSGLADHVIVEADGSRRRPFKAPYDYEPVIPSATTLLLACIGARALGGRIDEVCLRPDAVVAITGGDETDVLSPTHAAEVLVSSRGSRKALPQHASFAVLVQRVREQDREAVTELAAAVARAASAHGLPEIPVLAIGALDRD